MHTENIISSHLLTPDEIPNGFCKCGCGNKTRLATSNKPYRGYVKGEPLRFLKAHNVSNLRHGHARNARAEWSREYMAWTNMKKRCLLRSGPRYADWGGRGILVCEQWANSFETFLRDIGKSPGRGYSLDRIDNAGNYEPSNCRWATQAEQAANKRSIKNQ